jgi:hypothetical protein
MQHRLRLVRGAKDRAGLAREAKKIQSLIRAGADVRLHRKASAYMAEKRMELTDVRAMLGNCRGVRQEAVGVTESPVYVVAGQTMEQKEERRISREFAIKVAVEDGRKPGSLGVLDLWQLDEKGS